MHVCVCVCLYAQELQSRVADDRRAIQAETAVRFEALAQSRERASAAASAASWAEQEAAFTAQLTASETACAQLQQQVAALQSAFRDFQRLKAAEVAALEERVVEGIASGTLLRPKAAGQDAGAVGEGREPAAAARIPANRRPLHYPTVSRARLAGGSNRPRANGLRRGVATQGVVRAGPADTHMQAAYPQQGVVGGVGAAAVAPGLVAGVADLGAPAGPGAAAVREVTAAAAAAAAEAARREVLFERLHRQRVEHQLLASRQAAQTLRARLRLTQRQLEGLRSTTIPTEEHQRVLEEVDRLREHLKVARAESARRYKALQTLQALCAEKNPGAAAALTAPDAAHSDLVAAAAALSAAEGAADALAAGALLKAAAASMQDAGPAGSTAAAASATPADHASRQQATAALAQEREARALLERRVRDLQSTLATKQQFIRELRQRIKDLEERQAANGSATGANGGEGGKGVAEVVEGLESRLRQATTSLQRKDTLIREMKTKLDSIAEVCDPSPLQKHTHACQCGRRHYACMHASAR